MNKRRLNIMGLLFALLCITVALAHLRICVLKGDEYALAAVSQRRDSLRVKNRRGKLYDRNRIPLVENSVARLVIGSEDTGRNSVVLSKRYSEDAPGSHLLGYTDSEDRGVSGLEKSFDYCLAASVYDSVNVVKSAGGDVIETAGMKYSGSGGEGSSVVLTMDFRIQKICRDVLEKSGVTGAVVVMDTRSFDVLAMESAPRYNQNEVSAYIGGVGGELINRCVFPYNAGSIFKIVTLCSALENNSCNYFYHCNGSELIEGHKFACHKADGHGRVDPADAFAKSCNCAFYRMGLELGGEKIIEMAGSFGFGDTIVCCADFSESTGNLPVKNSYAPLDCVNYAIGQGELLLTPLQVANMVAVIAAGGVSGKVNIADRIVDGEGRCKRVLREVGSRRVISPDTAYFVGEAMRRAVLEGTGSVLADNPARISGKTGTAETGWRQEGESMVHGWFCGYFPYENPRYAMAVLVENGGSGALSAAPVFGMIAEEITKIYPIG